MIHAGLRCNWHEGEVLCAVPRSRVSACAEQAIFFRFADKTDFPTAPLKISTTYVMPGCDEEVLLTVDRAYQQAVVRGCGRAVRA